MKVAHVFTVVFSLVVILISHGFAQETDEQMAPEESEQYIEILRGNYWGLVHDKASVMLTCKNQDQIRDDVAYAFETYATAWDLGFTEDAFENELAEFIKRHCPVPGTVNHGPPHRAALFYDYALVKRWIISSCRNIPCGIITV